MTELHTHCRDRTGVEPSQPDGPALWRSLEELLDDPAFQARIHREFDPAVLDRLDGLNRREVLKILAASFVFASLPSCRRQPPEYIVPATRSENQFRPNESTFFATAVDRYGYGIGVLAESCMGRPIKLEGNPDHPASLGATDAVTQAELLSFYDPDRSQVVFQGEDISTWDLFEQVLRTKRASLSARQGSGLCILSGGITSPTLLDELDTLRAALPEAHWYAYEPIDDDTARAGATVAVGSPVDIVYRLDRADVVLALDSDFLMDEPGSVRYARAFADRRRVRSGGAVADSMNRLYVVEPSPTVTGGNADHRLPMRPSRMRSFVQAIASALGLEIGRDDTESLFDERETQWIRAVAKDLQARGRTSLIICGRGVAPDLHALVLAMNARLGALGHTAIPIEPVRQLGTGETRPLHELTEAITGGRVDTLVIIGSNPAYDAPPEPRFSEHLPKVPLSMHMGLYRDETARACHWHLPMQHTLETWGDRRAFDGTATIVQPLIQPLYQGRSPLWLVSELSGKAGRTEREMVEAYWKRHAPAGDPGRWWRNVLQSGVVPESQAAVQNVSVNVPAVRDAVMKAAPSTAPVPDADTYELVYRADPNIGDGRYANNGWLQELAKPITKVTWENTAYISPAVAKRLGVSNGDVIRISVGERELSTPTWIVPGQADACVTLFLGYGRRHAGRFGSNIGVDVYTFRRPSAPWHEQGAAIRTTDQRREIACTQLHHLMENRGLVRTGTVEAFLRDPKALVRREGDDPKFSIYPNRLSGDPQWGMTIDLSTCIGCNACTIACQAENNIPVVGKEQVRRGREMQWIRVDNYFSGDSADPAMFHQPVPCMHCENAPCELVCPVGATTHSHDGLNEMTYNRCVGTRYCSNNCPYKVRRFNFLQFADLNTESLKLMRNPDVSVRARGVMEKCTYCVQRIRTAQIQAGKEDRPLREGEIVTACQQVCPTKAITFGDVADRNSAVSAEKREPHNYGILTDLNTRPRTTYLAVIRNPSPELM